METCPAVRAKGVAGEPVLFPMIELAARLAILARVTAPAAIVVPREPALEVTSPVRAGWFPAGRYWVAVRALEDDQVARYPVVPPEAGRAPMALGVMVALVTAVRRPLASQVITGVVEVDPIGPPAVITLVRAVARDPAVVVMSPERAGKFPAGRYWVAWMAEALDQVARYPVVPPLAGR